MNLIKIYGMIALGVVLASGQVYAQDLARTRADSIAVFLEQFELMNNLIEKDKLAASGLKFVKYEVNDQLTFDQVSLDTISPSTWVVIPTNVEENTFEVGKHLDPAVIATQNEKRAIRLDHYRSMNNVVIDLYWDYKGKQYITHGIFNLDNFDFVYDNFASNIVFFYAIKN